MYKIIFTHHFKRQLKGLFKKDENLKEKLLFSLKKFKKRETLSLGKGIFKIRLAGSAQGKSGGYRVHIFILETPKVLTPLCIYAKNKKENIQEKELIKHLHQVQAELKKWL